MSRLDLAVFWKESIVVDAHAVSLAVDARSLLLCEPMEWAVEAKLPENRICVARVARIFFRRPAGQQEPNRVLSSRCFLAVSLGTIRVSALPGGSGAGDLATTGPEVKRNPGF